MENIKTAVESEEFKESNMFQRFKKSRDFIGHKGSRRINRISGMLEDPKCLEDLSDLNYSGNLKDPD